MYTQAPTAKTIRNAVVDGLALGDDPDSRMSFPALEALEQFATRQSFHRGEEIYAVGEPAKYCYRIITGTVRTVGLDENGRRLIAEFLVPEDRFGFDCLDTHDLTAEALTETVVMCYPRRAVTALAAQNSALALRLRHFTMQKLRRAHETMFLLGRKSANERIAAFLLEMAERAPGCTRGSVSLPMTRGDIADHLGLTIETVSRTMSHLRRSGTIAATKSGIEVRDRVALERFGTCDRH